MGSPLLKFLSLFLLCSLCACQSPRPRAATPEHAEPAASGKKTYDLQTRNNSLALLDELLNDEKNLSKILIIKRESPDLKRLVKDISEAAGKGAKLLKTLAKEDSGLELARTDLPPGEQAARKEISKTKQHQLLHSKETEFEFQLLLTQDEALNYGAHLALVAAENEPQPGHAREISALAAQLRGLLERVLEMLRTRK